ncbi:hypothetical protein ABZU76_18325 [Amycolatopsis sp. NPDC005232]|uniref:hypothetical protein n=1 Tax=Amycolatopsis sp. NPDC005232 TaxID=3157027 RepID=UPI0033A57497
MSAHAVHPETCPFVERAKTFDVIGARSCYLHGGFLGGDLATGWRLEHGALPDLGPHLIDLWRLGLTPRGAELFGRRGSG